MAGPIYTAAATVTGGRSEGHGVTSDGALDVALRVPPEMGGEGGGITTGSGADIEDAARRRGDEMQGLVMNLGEGHPFVGLHQRIGGFAIAFGAAGATHVMPIRRHAAGRDR